MKKNSGVKEMCVLTLKKVSFVHVCVRVCLHGKGAAVTQAADKRHNEPKT